jgi:hypothetical protein
VQELWPLAKAAFELWWEGIKTAWAVLKRISIWLWNNVLKPIWTTVKGLWKRYIKPEIEEWWPRIKRAWTRLKKVATWLWEEVLVPIYTKIYNLWVTKVKPELEKWRDRIQRAWDKLKGLALWIWNNVLKPIWDKIVKVWNDVKQELEKWRTRIERAWDKLKGLGNWIKTNVMDPVFNAIKNGWEHVKSWMEDKKDMLLGPAKGIMGGLRTVMNTVIGGLNKVADILPGFDWHISLIPELAEGGNIPKRRVGNGFVTNGARAIVGEGKKGYPEFVIPTDPTHRKRARTLLGMAASKIGVGPEKKNIRNVDLNHGIPKYDIGGWIGDRWDDLKNVGSQLGDLTAQSVAKIMNPLIHAAHFGVNELDWGPARAIGHRTLDEIQDWVDQTEPFLKELLKKYTIPKGGNVSVGIPDNPGGRTVWHGGTFTNLFVAHLKKAEELAHTYIPVIQGGFRPATSYSGTSHQGDALDSLAASGIIVALRRVGIASGDRTGLGDWGPHSHSVPGPSTGHAAGSAPWQFSDYIARGGRRQPLNSPWGLAQGGIAKARRGGVFVRVAEGGKDEAIIPLPNNWRDGLLTHQPGSGNTTNNFYGELVFPNIKTGNDAQAFIENLKSISED